VEVTKSNLYAFPPCAIPGRFSNAVPGKRKRVGGTPSPTADRRCTAGTMGKTQRAKGCFNRCPQKNDVTSQLQEGRCRPKGTVGKVAEGTKDGLVLNSLKHESSSVRIGAGRWTPFCITSTGRPATYVVVFRAESTHPHTHALEQGRCGGYPLGGGRLRATPFHVSSLAEPDQMGWGCWNLPRRLYLRSV